MDVASTVPPELVAAAIAAAGPAAAAAAASAMDSDGAQTPAKGRRSAKMHDALADHGTETGKKEKNRVAAAASRARKKEYVQNLEKAIHVLTTEKLELQVKVATLTNQLWEQSIKIDELEKTIAELRAKAAAGGGGAGAGGEAGGSSTGSGMPKQPSDEDVPTVAPPAQEPLQ
jgi:hypothetical protein